MQVYLKLEDGIFWLIIDGVYVARYTDRAAAGLAYVAAIEAAGKEK